MKQRTTLIASLVLLVLLSNTAWASLSRITVSTATGFSNFDGALFNSVDGSIWIGSSYTATTTTQAYLSSFSAADPANAYIGASFNYLATLVIFSSFPYITAGAFDATTGVGYFIGDSTPTSIAKQPLTTAAVLSIAASSSTLNTGQDRARTIVLDTTNQVAYIGTQNTPAVIVKVQLSDLSVVSTITLPSGFEPLSAAVIDSAGQFAYFAGGSSVGKIAKVKLSNFTLNDSVTFAAGEGGIHSAVIDNNSNVGYFGTNNSPGKVIKVNLTSMTQSKTVTLNSGEDDLTSAVIDVSRSIALFGTNTSSGIVISIELINTTRKGSLSLQTGESFLRSAVIDNANQYAYFGTHTSSGTVIQVDYLAGAPEIITQPRDATVHPNDHVTFTVVALGRGLTYQWQKDSVDIAGATSASYTRTVVLTDDAAHFHCIVAGTNGSVTSNDATLTLIPVIKAYPNPWRVDRHAGLGLTFEGLLPNSTVKLFTLSAHWIKTLPQATGSTTWDLTNDNGERVASGYYFYVVTTSNDVQTVHGKIAIIR